VKNFYQIYQSWNAGLRSVFFQYETNSMSNGAAFCNPYDLVA